MNETASLPTDRVGGFAERGGRGREEDRTTSEGVRRGERWKRTERLAVKKSGEMGG